jgi:putative tryptophan/tyrosine transport system substrate-binding protein
MRRRDIPALIASAAAVWPLVASAQQPMPVIGWLSVRSPETENIPGRLGAFRRGLDEAGYVEGRNVAIEYRWAEGHNDRLPALAANLVARQVSVIAAVSGAPAAFAVKAATTTIPIVFYVGDPVQLGFVASLNRPGSNMTGVAIMSAELIGKRLDLLRELVPAAAVIAVLVNPTNTGTTELETRNLKDAAQALGLGLRFLHASSANEIDAAFERLAELRAGGLVVSADPFFTARKDQIVALEARHEMPAIHIWREFAEAGGLMSYGANNADGYRLAGVYTGKIFNGARPADLPVQQVVKLELVINLKTAKALGLAIPPTLLGRADEVIE